MAGGSWLVARCWWLVAGGFWLVFYSTNYQLFSRKEIVPGFFKVDQVFDIGLKLVKSIRTCYFFAKPGKKNLCESRCGFRYVFQISMEVEVRGKISNRTLGSDTTPGNSVDSDIIP